jgi:hypothetical protein
MGVSCNGGFESRYFARCDLAVNPHAGARRFAKGTAKATVLLAEAAVADAAAAVLRLEALA